MLQAIREETHQLALTYANEFFMICAINAVGVFFQIDVSQHLLLRESLKYSADINNCSL